MCYTDYIKNIVRGDILLYRSGTKFLTAAAAAVMAAIALMLCGCTEINEETPAPVTEATVPAEKPYPVSVGSLIFNSQPESVGSLSPAVTEIICELGYEDKLIGRSSYCNYPKNISAKVSLGSAANPDVDAIIAASPQLLVSHSPIAKKDITALENAGVRVWIISAPNSIEELYRYYVDIAAVFGGKPDSEEAADDAMKPLLTALKSAQGSIGSFVYIMSTELAAASNATFAGSFFSSFGENAAGDSEDISLTAEEIADLDPEWIILPSSVSVSRLPDEVSSLDAVQSGRVIILDDEVLERIERPTARLETVVYSILDQIRSVENGDSEEQDNEE